MAWERFTQTGRGFQPKASIWRGGQIGFNQGAVKRMKLREYDYAILLYDPDTGRIGVRLTNDEAEAGAVKILGRGTGAFVSAKAFLDFYEVLYPQDVKMDISYDETNELYVLESKEK
jgi:hypothetical protein